MFYVTEGKGRLFSSELKKATEKQIVQKLTDQYKLDANGKSYKVKIIFNNYENLTYDQAKRLAKESKVSYIDEDGNYSEVVGFETGVVVVGKNVDIAGGSPLANEGKLEGILQREVVDDDGRKFNRIVVNDDFGGSETIPKFLHEMGHMLGRTAEVYDRETKALPRIKRIM